MHYSNFADAAQKNIVLAGNNSAAANVVRKARTKRVKSVYRDARFRPLFQGLAHLQAARLRGETSVIYATPSHPLFPILHLNTDTLPSLSSLPPYPLTPEPITEEETDADARHWRQFYADTPRKQRTPASSRDLSDEARLEWFHHALRASGSVYSFTVNLSAHVSDIAKTKASAARWLQDRIAKRLNEAFGYTPDFWFVIEESDRHILHLHGEIGIGDDPALLRNARKAFRLACGEWETTRQHQAHTHPEPDVWWSNYVSKDAWKMKPPSPRMPFQRRRPISGDWYAATGDLRTRAGKLYDECRKHVIAVLNGRDVITMRKPEAASVDALPARKDETLSDEDLNMLEADLAAHEADGLSLTQEGTLHSRVSFSAGTHPARAPGLQRPRMSQMAHIDPAGPDPGG
ncbi:MAG: hypothetical protein IBJ07_20705 [Rhizobiaceae bacterium]|nr:hypothetical protein [Rhizobiaceae bacterium]